MCFVSVHVVHPHSSTDTATVWKNTCFILSDSLDFHIIDNLSITVHIFAVHLLISLSVDETLLPSYVNLSTNFRGLALRGEIAPPHLKHMYSVLFAFTWKSMSPAACSWLCSRDLTWGGVFARSARSSA